ncbi:hypothetical protein [Streptosporangium sp. 'caverna']|uniref:hypothetical protein n=1 Tax=Streptosporangium sp. 'caverna' TaxID=2202249 RepID=UPI0013A705C5|nr:hypothetical protein [Streptosporangium sp. 'caverna']
MSRSLKATHVFLVAALVAGLSACSGEGDSSAASATPTASATPAASGSASASPADSETAAPDPAASAAPTAFAEPTAEASSADAEADDTKPGLYLLGVISATQGEPGSITVLLDEGEVQPVVLSRTAVVLDVKGTICSGGKLPHKCTVQQLEKALASGKDPRAKVTVKDGVATRIEELAGN